MTSAFGKAADRRRRRGPAGVLIGLSSVLVANVTRAQGPANLDLRWEAPRGCPQAQAVLDRIRKISGSGGSAERRLQAEGKITRVQGRFRLTLILRDGTLAGERTIESESCADLAGAAAVALGLLLHSGEPLTQEELGARPVASDPPSRSANPSSAPANDSAPKPPRARPDPVEGSSALRELPELPSSERSARAWRAVLQAPLLSAEWGPLPNASPGLGLGVGLRYEAWRFVIVGRLPTEQRIWAEEFSSYASDVSHWTGALRACHGWRSIYLELSACAALALERVSAVGVGPGVTPQTQQANWASGGLTVVGYWHLLEPLALLVSAGGRIEGARPQILIAGLGPVHQLAPTAFALELGSEWIF